MIDAPTAALTRPKLAKLAVEVDLRKPLPHQIWIGEEKEGFWQQLIFQKVPLFCAGCKKIGHSVQRCSLKMSGGLRMLYSTDGNRRQGSNEENGRGEKKFASCNLDLSIVNAVELENLNSEVNEVIVVDDQKEMVEGEILDLVIHDNGQIQSLESLDRHSLVEVPFTDSNNFPQGIQDLIAPKRSIISEEEQTLILSLGKNSEQGKKDQLIRTYSCPILRKQCYTGNPTTAGTDLLPLQKNNEGNQPEIQGLLQSEDSASRPSGIVVDVKFEEQASPTITKKVRSGKIKYQSSNEIQKKRERQESRNEKKKTKSNQRDKLYDCYSDTDKLYLPECLTIG